MTSGQFSLPLRIDRQSGEPYQLQIVQQVEQLILSGPLKAGDRLPSIVAMTALLGVSKNTVLGAFDKLADAGFIEGERGRGYFVSTEATVPLRAALQAEKPKSRQYRQSRPETGAGPAAGNQPCVYKDSGVHIAPPCVPVRHDFKVGRPSAQAFPRRKWSRLSNELLLHGGSAITTMSEYAPAQGLWGLRMHIADYLCAAKAMRVEPEQVIIVAGIQEALSLLAAHFLAGQANSRVVVESPGYSGFCNLLELYRARIHPVAVDEEGIDTRLLPSGHIKLAYVTPSHQYPLGYTLSLRRREQLVAWAADSGAYVIEDDYDGDFCYRAAPLPSLMALDGQSVIHLGTFSKVLGPGLRLGYMVCPPGLAAEMEKRKGLLNIGCPSLDQAIMARFFENNDYVRHLHWLRKLYREQRDCLTEGLPDIFGDGCRITGENAGMHLALHLGADNLPARSIVQNALRCGVRLYTLADSACFVAPDSALNDRVLLFGYSAVDCAGTVDALQRLANCPVFASSTA